MIKKYLSFRIELTNKDWNNSDSIDKSDEFAKQFCSSFGLKTHSGTWSGIYLDSPFINEFVREAKKLINNGVARFDGYCSLGYKYMGDSQWYRLGEGQISQDAYVNDYNECKAYKYSPNMHIDGCDGRNTL